MLLQWPMRPLDALRPLSERRLWVGKERLPKRQHRHCIRCTKRIPEGPSTCPSNKLQLAPLSRPRPGSTALPGTEWVAQPRPGSTALPGTEWVAQPRPGSTALPGTEWVAQPRPGSTALPGTEWVAQPRPGSTALPGTEWVAQPRPGSTALPGTEWVAQPRPLPPWRPLDRVIRPTYQGFLNSKGASFV
eukprot:365535-Chlamydomonas_euryale.AAC.68